MNDIITEDQKSPAVPYDTEDQRAIAEVKAAVVMAKKFPRNETQAYLDIKQACKRYTFAQSAAYSYPRGGQNVTGPSIRMAETMARLWGNMDFGIKVLSQDNIKGTSEVMAFAWDIQSNVRQTRIFTVSHKRKARGGYQRLEDPRDIYEYEANLGSRRVRACILGLIPADVIEDAMAECNKTLAGNSDRPIKERIRDMAAKFEKVGVTRKDLEERLGHPVDEIIEAELPELIRIFTSIRDGVAKIEDYFKRPDASAQEAAQLTEDLKGKAETNV